jgi:hypothetical protein
MLRIPRRAANGEGRLRIPGAGPFVSLRSPAAAQQGETGAATKVVAVPVG